MSSRNALFTGAIALLLSLAAPACAPTLQDARFSCARDSDCPGGFVCHASDMLCYRGGADAGPLAPDSGLDAGARDAGSDAPTDAAVGCGPNCVQIIVLNADPGTSGTLEFVDTNSDVQHIPIPPYGTTSATMDVPNVPVGGQLHVNVPPTATIFYDLDIPTEGRYLLVLGPASSGANVLLLPENPAGLHTGGYVYIRLIDMTADETIGLIARGAGRNPADQDLPNAFQHGTISPELPFLPGTGALRLELGPSSPQLIAALLADQLPGTEGTYYVVVSGRVSAHLDTMDGLRFIPGLPSSTALRSGRLVRFLNTLGTTATVCDGATPLNTLIPGQLGPPRVPPASTAWTLSVHTGGDCTTGLSHDVVVGTAVGRTLVSITGDITDPTMWAAVSMSEPMPVAGNSTIVIHNALPVTADIAGATAIPSLVTASVSVVSLPTTITATTMLGTWTFGWSPTTQQSWVVVTSAGGATYTAYEVDSPFDATWAVTVAPSL